MPYLIPIKFKFTHYPADISKGFAFYSPSGILRDRGGRKWNTLIPNMQDAFLK
jgi:hypothetical protein